MTANHVKKALHHLKRVLKTSAEADASDGQLLGRFVSSRDESAFNELVRRHGPMVLGVCRRILRHTQDAEDAFQAAFLVLARKASSVANRQAVGSWLYRVSYRIALEAKIINDKRRNREKQMAEMPHPEVAPTESSGWLSRLDYELNLLPEHYRAVIVACDLEGRSRKEVARNLGLSEGTVSSRLARGRGLLAKRLSRYGLALSGSTLAVGIAEVSASAPVSVSLLSSTSKLALGQMAFSGSIEFLVKGALKTMLLSKLKVAVGAVMVMVALGTTGFVYRASGQSAPAVEQKREGKPRTELEALRRENELLKLNLEVVLEKVRAQEAELRSLRGKDKSTGKAESDSKKTVEDLRSELSLWEERAAWSERMSGRGYVTVAKALLDDAQKSAARRALGEAQAQLDVRKQLLDAEIALKAMREASDRESRRHAVDQLEKVLKMMREQLKKPETPATPAGK